ncbi:MAG: Mur ligase family protein [Hyphomonadaceae bacterium]|nr:Mur ligase family protein [Hyphomonadaceae bacterium]
MSPTKRYFFCGVGGSGMLPLALIVRAQGHAVAGSDRALDQGRLAEKFDYLRARGVQLHPQDGSGVTDAAQIVVASGAVEDTVPDLAAAKRVGAEILRRPTLLAELFNAAKVGVAIGGTSGKSTVTAMTGWILHAAGRDPTIMNGAVMKNFVGDDGPYASARVGAGETFVAEVDESDGSIALYAPTVAVLNNIALDHKSMDELRALFGDFLAKGKIAVVNLDNDEAARLARAIQVSDLFSYSVNDPRARWFADEVALEQDGARFVVHERGGDSVAVRLHTPGLHNVSNALAAIAAARACGVDLAACADALARFAGVKRRLDVIGTAHGVTVIDDFAHNPDKIAATLRTLHAFPGRLLVVFQPHGFGPLRLMRRELAETFAAHMTGDDVLLMTEPVYFGGTTDRSVSSGDVAADIAALGKTAIALPDRTACIDRLLTLARAGDRIVIMGARDDTLTQAAEDLLACISARSA